MSPSTPVHLRRTGATLAGVAALTAAASLLAVSGATLPFPTDLHPARLAAWADAVGGPTVAFTFLRALAAALVLWCAVGWVLGVAARLGRRPAAVRLTDRMSFPVVRRLADAVAGLAVVGASLSPVAVAAAPAPQAPDPSVVVMTDLGPAPSPSATTTTVAPAAPDGSVDPGSPVPSPGAPSSPPSPGPTTPSEPLQPPDDAPPSPPTDAVGPTWVIASGDTLWHVAQASLADDLGRAPSPVEVLQQLDRLVAANLDRLAVPGHPDLVFPGQEFLVP